MSDVEIICEKSFSEIDSEIINRFVEFQQAIIDKDEGKLMKYCRMIMFWFICPAKGSPKGSSSMR